MLKTTILLILTSCCLSWIYAQEKYHYNQNYQATNFLSEGLAKFTGYRTTYDGTKKYFVSSEMLIETYANDLDADGLPSTHMIFYTKKTFFSESDTLVLMPENPFYPLTLVCYKIQKTTKGYAFGQDNGYAYSPGNYYIIIGGGLVQQVEVNYDSHAKPGYYLVGTGPQSWDNIYFSTSGSGGEFSSYKDFAKELNIVTGRSSYGITGNEYPGVGDFYNARKKYFENLTKVAQEKKYEGLMGDFQEGDYYLYDSKGTFGSQDLRGYTCDIVKLKIKKENNKINSFQFQNSFTDGVFHDLEKFYTNFNMSNGKLISSESNMILPFAGRLLIISSDGYIKEVITPYLYDQMAIFLIHRRDSRNVGDHGHGIFSRFDTSPKWWCKQNLDETYTEEKDLARISVLYKNYKTALGFK